MSFVVATALLCGILVVTDGAPSPTGGPRIIFKKPSDSPFSEIHGSTTPWVKPELVQAIGDFKKNVLDGLAASAIVQAIWGNTWDSVKSRDVFFKIGNAFFTQYDHPVPAALANILSKSASLFDPLTKQTNFEAVAVSIRDLRY